MQDARLFTPVTMHTKGFTPASVTADDGIVHGHLSNFKHGPFNMLCLPSLKFTSQKKQY